MYSLSGETQAKVLYVLAEYAEKSQILWMWTAFVTDETMVSFVTREVATRAMKDLRNKANVNATLYTGTTRPYPSVVFSRERSET
jgi:hypothetical protein